MTAKERYEQAHGTGTGECTIPRGTYNRDRTGSTLIMEMLFAYSVYPLRKPPFCQGDSNIQGYAEIVFMS